jgi:hypothetical protein
MSINCDYADLIKDKNVRYILQKIHDELGVSKADKPHVLAKIPSYDGKVELFGQNISEENDEFFIRCLSDNNVITNIDPKVCHPEENKSSIDYSLLNSPDEFKTPYIAISFDVLNIQFFKRLYEDAIDALIVNPYPKETQQDLINTTIVKIKAQTQADNIILSWNEIDVKDRKHIGIFKTLQSLEADKLIKVLRFDGKLDLPTEHGNTEFESHILYTPAVPFTGKDILMYQSMALDQKSRKVYYPKLKNISKVVGFREENKYYRVLRAFIDKKVLSYTELFRLIDPYRKVPNIFSRKDKRKIEVLINSLKQKFNNLSLFVFKDDSYELTP